MQNGDGRSNKKKGRSTLPYFPRDVLVGVQKIPIAPPSQNGQFSEIASVTSG